MSFTFSKAERLCSRRQIERLYAEGHRLMAFPYSVQWIASESTQRCQVMIVAPKRKFRHAVDRNRVKRLTRECWRMRKQRLYDGLAGCGMSIALSLVYVHNEPLTYEQLGNKMDKLIVALLADIEKHSQQ